jgi:CRISPR-associated exonuclease Cas4
LRYREKEFKIDFDDELRDLVLEKIEVMREQIDTGVVHRNHHRPGKCHNCSRREHCPEKLA